jgi:hypothetical protein
MLYPPDRSIGPRVRPQSRSSDESNFDGLGSSLPAMTWGWRDSSTVPGRRVA